MFEFFMFEDKMTELDFQMKHLCSPPDPWVPEGTEEDVDDEEGWQGMSDVEWKKFKVSVVFWFNF